jgi:hypothetical protein
MMTWVAPDWMLSYTIPASELPLGFLHAVFVVSLVLLALGGHTLNAILIQRGRARLAIAVTVLAAGVWISSHILTAERYMSVGTFDDFYAHRTVPLPESSIAKWANLNFALLVWWVVPAIVLYRNGRRLRPT